MARYPLLSSLLLLALLYALLAPSPAQLRQAYVSLDHATCQFWDASIRNLAALTHAFAIAISR